MQSADAKALDTVDRIVDDRIVDVDRIIDWGRKNKSAVYRGREIYEVNVQYL